MKIKTFCLFESCEEAVNFAKENRIPTHRIRAFDYAADMRWAIEIWIYPPDNNEKKFFFVQVEKSN